MAELMTIHQNFNWSGNTLIVEIVSKIAGDLEKEFVNEVCRHYEIDLTELCECLEAKRNGIELAPVVRCKDCKRMCEDKIFGNLWCNRFYATFKVKPDDFCSYGERIDNGV